MIRAAFLAGVLATSFPAAAAEVSVGAQATILDPASLRVSWVAGMPTVTEDIDGARFVGRFPSLGLGTTLPANARLVILRVDDSGRTVTAPASFEVASAGRGQGLIVRTSSRPDADALASLDGLIVGGDLPGGSAASIDVARGPSAASADTLMVVVQYN